MRGIPQNSEKETWQLSFDDVKEVNTAMVDTWQQWIDAAPEHWKKDGFLAGSVPLAVTSRYGQNRLISKGRGDDEQWKQTMKMAFNQERRYDMVRFVSFALATDVR